MGLGSAGMGREGTAPHCPPPSSCHAEGAALGGPAADGPRESLPAGPRMAALSFAGRGGGGGLAGREGRVGPDGWVLAAAPATLLGVRGPGSAGPGQAEGEGGS